MTRFGDKTGHVVFVEQEQRFKWQKALDKVSKAAAVTLP